MSQPVPLRPPSFSFSPPYLDRVHRLPQVPTSALPFPEVMLRKALGVILTLFKSTLGGVLVSVDSKGLADMLNPLDATLTKNPGGGGPPRLILTYPTHLCRNILLFRPTESRLVNGQSQRIDYSRFRRIRRSRFRCPALQLLGPLKLYLGLIHLA